MRRHKGGFMRTNEGRVMRRHKGGFMRTNEGRVMRTHEGGFIRRHKGTFFEGFDKRRHGVAFG
jgi:hypothetical protein